MCTCTNSTQSRGYSGPLHSPLNLNFLAYVCLCTAFYVHVLIHCDLYLPGSGVGRGV